MDFLTGKIRPIYLRYLGAAFGSALITSIYSLADMAMVGQYQGPEGTAALTVVAPIWNIVYSFGLLTGIGGSVLFSILKGRRKGDSAGEGQEYFSVAVGSSLLIALILWLLLLLFEQPILRLFGADQQLLGLAKAYLRPIKWVFPCYLFNQMLAAFLRNDNDPGLATLAVLAGGVFNIFGDYVFIFKLDMGIFGAGLATALGGCLTLILLLGHFFSKRNSLKLVRPQRPRQQFGEIAANGFSTFFIDVAMGLLTLLFNRQISTYLNTDALAVYGVIVNISTLVQCCAYSVGQASQPIISSNFGAQQGSRIKQTLKYALLTVLLFSCLGTGLSLLFPKSLVKLFMTPNGAILELAPAAIRSYSLSFLLLPLNIFSTYYFQALLKPKIAFVISLMRGLIFSGSLILLLPKLVNIEMIWLAMPLAELLTACYVVFTVIKYTKMLPQAKNSVRPA